MRGLLQKSERIEGAGLLRKRSDLPKPRGKLGVELERRDGGRKEISRQPLRWRESLNKEQSMSYLTLLTGPRGSGKTTWCTRLASKAKEKNLDVGGLLSPGIFHNNEKIGIDLLNIATGEQRPLAHRFAQPSQSICLGEWGFDPAILDWGNQILQTLNNQDLILLDELGPLEFEKGIGLIAGMKLIDEKTFHHAVVVIRPELLHLAQKRWPEAKVVDVSCVDPKLPTLKQDTA
jgi:nucleoside-triphosphatase